MLQCLQLRGLYFVKWIGYDESDNTWEPIGNLEECKEKLKEFYHQRIKDRESATPVRYFKRRKINKDRDLRDLRRPLEGVNFGAWDCFTSASLSDLASKWLQTLYQKNIKSNRIFEF